MSTHQSRSSRRRQNCDLTYAYRVQSQTRWMKNNERARNQWPDALDELADEYIIGLVHGGKRLDLLEKAVDRVRSDTAAYLQWCFARACAQSDRHRGDTLLPGMYEPWFRNLFARARERQTT